MGLFYVTTSDAMVPSVPPIELAHAADFERFDGLEVPTGNGENAAQLGSVYGGRSPWPGMSDTPIDEQTYTKAPIRGTVGTVGGQPLPVDYWLHGDRGYTPSETPSIQYRLGAGQANQGAAQTVALSEITNNPPVPGDISSIIAGWS